MQPLYLVSPLLPARKAAGKTPTLRTLCFRCRVLIRKEPLVTVRPWLKDFCAKLNRSTHTHSRRLRRHDRAVLHFSRAETGRSLEKLEDRTLLAASVLFGSGELQIITDANETVLIRDDPATPGRVDVQVGTGSAAATTAPSLPNVATTDVTSIVLVTGAGNNTIDLSGVLASAFTGLTSISVQSGNGDDSITGGNADDTISGGDGNDTIAGGSGNDNIDAGDGDDSVSGDDGDDTILGDDGNDTIAGNSGNDSVLAGDGLDSVSGNEGLDTLNGNSGADTISGDDGADFLLGGGGADLVSGGLEGDTIIGNSGADTLSGDDGDDFVDGGNSNDSILAGEGNDTLNGMAGDDTLDGGGGDDTILGGDGADLALGDGPDVNIVTFGNDVIRGQGGNDTLRGTLGADTIEGGAGDDEIQSELSENLPPPVPSAPVAPPLPPTPPFVTQFDPAVSTGGTTDLGASAVLSVGSGDLSLAITVDAAGQPTTTLYDPAGAVGPTDPGNSVNSNFTGIMVDGGAVAQLDAQGASLTGTTGDVSSTFTQSGLDFSLIQQIEPLRDSNATTIGALFSQTYGVTNPTAATVTLEFLRGTHYHSSSFGFGGVSLSAGGRIVDSTGIEILVQSNMLGDIDTAGTLTGITGLSGDPVIVSRFGVGNRPFTVTDVPSRLNDIVVDDNDGNGFDDLGRNDIGLSLRSVFTIPAGAAVQFSQHLFFADAAPSAVAGTVNTPPVATSDTVSTFATPVTFVPVTNDTDADGVLNFASIQIETQPANGTAVSLGDGRITYTANPGFSGVDTFTYSIADDGGARSAPATVTITVIEAADTIGDSLDGGLGDDTIVGGAGDDFINGRSGNDSLSGAAGNDTILGGAGDDILSGGTGNDTLDGQSGNDVINGDEGEDVIVFGGAGDGLDTVDGDSGSDTVRVQGTANNDTFRVAQDASGLLIVSQGAATITIDPSSVQAVIVNGLAGNDFIGIDPLQRVGRIVLMVNGGLGDDTIDAGGRDTGSVVLELNGQVGDDTLAGGKQNDRLNGGVGDDSLIGGEGRDTLSGNDGQDIIAGGIGDDLIRGGSGNDTLAGDDGNDLIDGGLDNDVVSGGNGNDTLRGNFGDDALNGMAGDDSIMGSSGRDTLAGGSGNDTLDGGRNDDRIRGQGGNDTLRGDHGDDFISGDAGNDEIIGEDGDDTIMGGNGADGIAGGDGNDLIEGQGMEDTITGGDGNDTLRGGGSDDTILGEQGDDVINGNSGTDTGATGEGADAIPESIEILDESFMLSSEMMMNLDGV